MKTKETHEKEKAKEQKLKKNEIKKEEENGKRNTRETKVGL